MIKFDGKNIEDWNLLLVSYYIPMPKPKSNYVDIPGGDGRLDLSEAFGRVCYDAREGASFVFDYIGDYVSWYGMISSLAGYLHGRKRKIVLDADPGFYYHGRLRIDGQKTNEVVGTVTITGTLDPYKYKKDMTVKQMSGSGSLNCTNLFAPVVPTITADSEYTISSACGMFTVGAGTYRIPDLVLSAGDNPLTLTGTGSITIRYQEAGL